MRFLRSLFFDISIFYIICWSFGNIVCIASNRELLRRKVPLTLYIKNNIIHILIALCCWYRCGWYENFFIMFLIAVVGVVEVVRIIIILSKNGRGKESFRKYSMYIGRLFISTLFLWLLG